jgi:hypothetical protein
LKSRIENDCRILKQREMWEPDLIAAERKLCHGRGRGFETRRRRHFFKRLRAALNRRGTIGPRKLPSVAQLNCFTHKQWLGHNGKNKGRAASMRAVQG